MSYEEYLVRCGESSRPVSWRKGQFYFNMLYQVRPDLSEAVRCTELDPFHDDQRIPAFLAWIDSMWEARR